MSKITITSNTPAPSSASDSPQSGSFTEDRRLLSANLAEVERDNEHFPYNYLPADVQLLLREAFGCYTADLFYAFAILCRRCVSLTDITESANSQSRLEALFDEAVRLGDVDLRTRKILREVLFGKDFEPAINADEAAVLIELIKDIFKQRYVRSAKLRRAIKVRRYFAHELKAKAAPLPE